MKKYLDRIKKFGHKITYQRMEVLRVLFKHEELLTVKRLHLKLKNRIDLASVYRTINLFKDLKIIFEEKINDQSFYYLSDHPHHHIMCRNCGFIQINGAVGKIWGQKRNVIYRKGKTCNIP